MPKEHIIETDVLVIGGGVAGCFAAIKAREQGLDVTIVDKGYAGKSGASIMASGWWAVFNPEWGHDLDTCMNLFILRNDYIVNREWTETILKDSWETYEDIASWGVEFPVEPDKRKDWYAQEVIRGRPGIAGPVAEPPYVWIPLRHRKTSPFLRIQAEKVGVRIMDRIMVTDLLEQDGKVDGAVGFPMESYDSYVFKAKATVLCASMNNFKSPGYHTSNITGDADAMAYRAGAEISGKEFPDTYHFTMAKNPAWKGDGELYAAYMGFIDAEGREISFGTTDSSLTIHAGKGPIFWNWDSATPEDLKAMQAYAWKRANPHELSRIGLDLAMGGKHQILGGAAGGSAVNQTSGIWPVDTTGASSLPGLFAAGDCCCTWSGIFWGLTSAAVTGKRAGAAAADNALKADKPKIDEEELARLRKIMYAPGERKGGFSPRWVTQQLLNTMMPYYIMFVKHGDRLQAALTTIEFLKDHITPKMLAKDSHELRLCHETKNMILNAEMMLRASLFRTESRFLHYREDYPRRNDPGWLAFVKYKQKDGRMKLWKEPLPEKWWPDLSKPYEQRYAMTYPEE